MKYRFIVETRRKNGDGIEAHVVGGGDSLEAVGPMFALATIPSRWDEVVIVDREGGKRTVVASRFA